MPSLRAAAILATFLVVTVVAIPWQWMLLKLRLPQRKTFPHRYHRFVAFLFGIRIKTVGVPIQSGGALMVANHTSWLDIILLSAAARVSFIAKGEVANWPFFSILAKLQETVFVERARRSKTHEARDAIRDRLLAGETLVLFPEGTSSDGNRVLPFKSALMGAAEARIATGDGSRPVKIQPVTVAYLGLYGVPMGRENRPLFAWYGDMDLVPHIWEALKSGPIDVLIRFHPPMTVDDAGGRKPLALAAEAAVRRGLFEALAAGPMGNVSRDRSHEEAA